MSTRACTTCGGQFQWAWDSVTDRWVMLEPVESHSDLDRTYVDENGELRADHRDRHQGGASVNVSRLTAKVPAGMAADEAQASTLGKIAKRVRDAVG